MKKDKDMFTIGEAAEAIGITRRIILNYESRGLIDDPDAVSFGAAVPKESDRGVCCLISESGGCQHLFPRRI